MTEERERYLEAWQDALLNKERTIQAREIAVQAREQTVASREAAVELRELAVGQRLAAPAEAPAATTAESDRASFAQQNYEATESDRDVPGLVISPPRRPAQAPSAAAARLQGLNLALGGEPRPPQRQVSLRTLRKSQASPVPPEACDGDVGLELDHPGGKHVAPQELDDDDQELDEAAPEPTCRPTSPQTSPQQLPLQTRKVGGISKKKAAPKAAIPVATAPQLQRAAAATRRRDPLGVPTGQPSPLLGDYQPRKARAVPAKPPATETAPPPPPIPRASAPAAPQRARPPPTAEAVARPTQPPPPQPPQQQPPRAAVEADLVNFDKFASDEEEEEEYDNDVVLPGADLAGLVDLRDFEKFASDLSDGDEPPLGPGVFRGLVDTIQLPRGAAPRPRPRDDSKFASDPEEEDDEEAVMALPPPLPPPACCCCCCWHCSAASSNRTRSTVVE